MSEPIKVADLNQLTREEWLAARRQGLGSSDAPAILGWSPWASAWSVWLDKVEGLADDSETEAMFFGTHLEPAIASAFAERTGWGLVDLKVTQRHPELDWMLASPDRLIAPSSEPPTPKVGSGLLELKNVSAYKADEWTAAEPDADGILRGGEAPAMYLAQVQHQHAVLGTTWGYLCALLGGNKLCIVEVPRDEEFVSMLVAAEEEFWTSYVQTRTPPPIDGAEPTTEALVRMFSESDPEAEVELDEAIARAAADYRRASEAVKAAEARKAEAGNRLREFLGEAEVGTYRGTKLVSWKPPKPSKRVDLDALRADFPEVAEKVTKEVPGDRRLLVAPSKAAKELLDEITDGEDK